MAIHEQIRKLRTGQNLTQEELAKKAGIAVNTLRLYESGKRQPQPKQRQLLADALNVPVTELIGSTEVLKKVEPVSYKFYPTEKNTAILCTTKVDGSTYIETNHQMTPSMEEIPWRLPKDGVEIIEILVDAYSNQRPKQPFPPEISAGIKVMLDKLAEKGSL